MKRTRSSKKRLRRRSRKHRGGGPPIDPATIPWPPRDGCSEGSDRTLTLSVGSYIDRFGPTTGFYASPIVKQPYSYSERSMPWLGLTNSKITKRNGSQKSIRRHYYYIDYENPLIEIDKDNYHVYEVMQPIDVKECTAAPYFDYPGGARQYKFQYSIQKYIDEGKLREDIFFPVVPEFD
jgi:hypothetical protein